MSRWLNTVPRIVAWHAGSYVLVIAVLGFIASRDDDGFQQLRWFLIGLTMAVIFRVVVSIRQLGRAPESPSRTPPDTHG